MDDLRVGDGVWQLADPSCAEVDERVVWLEAERRRWAAEAAAVPTRVRLDEALAQIEAGLRGPLDVASDDLAALDAVDARDWLVRLEQTRRMLDATSVRAASAIDGSNPFREAAGHNT